jgi:hypothetical protein
VIWYLQLDECLLDRGKHTKIAASGTPVGFDFAFQVGHCHVIGLCWSRRHFAFSSN